MDIWSTAAVVTVGASGLRLGIAKLLAAAAANVRLLDVNADLGIAAAAAVVGRFIGTNTTDESAVEASLDNAIIA